MQDFIFILYTHLYTFVLVRQRVELHHHRVEHGHSLHRGGAIHDVTESLDIAGQHRDRVIHLQWHTVTSWHGNVFHTANQLGNQLVICGFPHKWPAVMGSSDVFFGVSQHRLLDKHLVIKPAGTIFCFWTYEAGNMPRNSTAKTLLKPRPGMYTKTLMLDVPAEAGLEKDSDTWYSTANN